MKYKLLVLDVDGTLLNDAKEISKRTLASLLKVQQMGIRVALASGRPTYGLMLNLSNFYKLKKKNAGKYVPITKSWKTTTRT